MIERLVALAIIGFARAVTGARALWVGSSPPALPQARPTVYFANHRSHGDFVLLWSCLPPRARARTRPVAGLDYWGRSALRRFVACRVFGALLIDRSRATPDADPLAGIVEALRHGDSVIYFPEGTRNETDDALLPLKGGIHRLAQRCPDARFVPVWIDNLHRVLPKGELIPVPLACTVAFGAPLPAADAAVDRDAFLAAARDALLALRPAHDRESTA